MVRAAALIYPRAQRSPGARRGPRPWATPRGEAAWALRSRRRRWGASARGSARVHSIGPRPLGGGRARAVCILLAGSPGTGVRVCVCVCVCGFQIGISPWICQRTRTSMPGSLHGAQVTGDRGGAYTSCPHTTQGRRRLQLAPDSTSPSRSRRTRAQSPSTSSTK